MIALGMAASPRLPLHVIRMVLRMREVKASYRRITKETGVSSRTIAKILKRAGIAK